jgi:hypothetical protein
VTGIADLLADRFHDPDAFMSQNRSGLHTWNGSPDHVEVGSADGAHTEAYYRIGLLLNSWLGHVV